MRHPHTDEIIPGATFVDITSGPVTVRGYPHRISGGEVVDVTSILWDGSLYPWTAVVTNLRVVPSS